MDLKGRQNKIRKLLSKQAKRHWRTEAVQASCYAGSRPQQGNKRSCGGAWKSSRRLWTCSTCPVIPGIHDATLVAAPSAKKVITMQPEKNAKMTSNLWQATELVCRSSRCDPPKTRRHRQPPQQQQLDTSSCIFWCQEPWGRSSPFQLS